MERSKAAEASAGQKILVVEDEPSLVDTLEYSLTRQGYTVRVATDGVRALEAARKEQPDLVVLDVMLPGLNAWKLQQAIRQKGETPLLFLTTPGGIEDRLRGLELHEDDYLLKPFEAKTLVARVKKVLRRDRGR